MRKFKRILTIAAAGILLLCLAAGIVSALSNLGLPTQLTVVDRLSELEKARLAEANHLRWTLGDQVWSAEGDHPGWKEADIPIILYNSEYAFLVGLDDPAPGWLIVPGREQRGDAWDRVPGETLQGYHYYRQRLSDPGITPQAFTVLVRDSQGKEHWVASFQTREYAQISLVQGLRETMPGPLKPVFPYRLIWQLLMGDTETHLGAISHEAFHAYEGMLAPERLAQSETVMQLNRQYPWGDPAVEAAWQAEMNKLFDATQAHGNEQIVKQARQFLALRDERREKASLSAALIDFEQQREWEEGLAKYAELEIQRQAALTKNYHSLPEILKDPDFKNYSTRLQYWNNQLGEVKRLSNREAETRFYYSGFAQAVLLDRLSPGWKEHTPLSSIWLEDLLRQASQ
jgi:hypothetical protein